MSGACRVSYENLTSVKNVNEAATVSVEDTSLIRPCIMGRIRHYICYWYFDWNQEKRLLNKKTTTSFMKPVFGIKSFALIQKRNEYRIFHF
jgi:hypothetical protein